MVPQSQYTIKRVLQSVQLLYMGRLDRCPGAHEGWERLAREAFKIFKIVQTIIIEFWQYLIRNMQLVNPRNNQS